MSEKVMHFPWLHPKLGQGVFPEGTVLFDPGVDMPSDRPRWRPDDLPCSPAEVRATLRSFMEFGERFPKATDMQTYQVIGLENFYTDTTLEFRSQLLGGVESPEPDDTDRRRQAQLLLAMALYREEQFVTMCEQEGRFESAREGFAQVLGLDDEEEFADYGVSEETLFPRAAAELPWKNLLPAFLFFLPERASLYISDPDVLRELLALGLEFAPCGPEEDGLACCRLDSDGAERICGRRVELSEPLTVMAYPLEPLTSENGV